MVVLIGTISFKQPVWKKQQTFETLTTQGQFYGLMLHHRGFAISYSEPVTLIFLSVLQNDLAALRLRKNLLLLPQWKIFELKSQVQLCNLNVFPIKLDDDAQRLLGCHLHLQCH